MTTFGSILKSPIWRAKNAITYTEDALAPTLWEFDQNGFVRPSDNRPVSPSEQTWVDDFNADRARMNEASRRAV